MTSVDPATGALNWELSGLFDRMVVASPIVAPGFVIGTCGAVDGGNFLVGVRMTGREPRTVPQVAYKVKLSASYVPTPIVKGHRVFMWNDNGIVTCLRIATGEQVWRERVGGRGQFFGSPVCVNDRLYCISVEGDVVVLAASDRFQLLARNPLGEKSYATPALADGRMYLRTFSHLISIGSRPGP
jgi:outer membrane protein assembly factor BamB